MPAENVDKEPENEPFDVQIILVNSTSPVQINFTENLWSSEYKSGY
jgi:hypothetical protein